MMVNPRFPQTTKMSLRFAGIESEETEHDRDGPQ